MGLGPYWVNDRPLETVAVFVTRDGVPVALDIYSGATVRLTGPDDLAVAGSENITVDLADDRALVSWPAGASVFLTPGWYTLQLTLTATNVADTVDPISFEVYAPEPSVDPAWADARDVLTLTGTQVTAGQLAQAQGIVELHTGVSHAMTVGRLRGVDKRALRQAVAYQAAFIAGAEGLFTRAGVDSLSQDGLNVSAAKSGGDTDTDTFTLAPLARAALRQLTLTKQGDKTTYIGRTPRRSWDPDDMVPAVAWQPVGGF